MISAEEALDRLRDGNQRFVANKQSDKTRANYDRRMLTAERQSPFAIILGCSDSRVPAEIVFDQGLGDLFVIRVAGNIVAPSQIGSVEYATAQFGTRLVVVLGHSRCGAVLATLESVQKEPTTEQSENSRSIIERIRPAVESLVGTEKQESLWEAAVRANVRASVEQLTRDSTILARLVEQGKLRIVGAEYSLETGAVEFLQREGASR